jgi:hypothetical protein
VLLVLLAFLIGLCLAVLGGGGSLLMVPLLVYGLHVEPKAAIMTSLLVVLAASSVALVGYARSGQVAWRTGLVFGGVAMVGAFAGGKLAGFVSDRALLGVFAVVMAATALFMMRAPRLTAPEKVRQPQPPLRILAEGLVVGVVTGLVGAGGGFLIVPALILFDGLPMRLAVGTSLFIIAVNSLAGLAGHLSHAQVDARLAVLVSVIAAVGAVAGSRIAFKVPVRLLRRGFAWLALVIAVLVGLKQLPTSYLPRLLHLENTLLENTLLENTLLENTLLETPSREMKHA